MMNNVRFNFYIVSFLAYHLTEEELNKARMEAFGNIVKRAGRVQKNPMTVSAGKYVIVGLYSRTREANRHPLFCCPAKVIQVLSGVKVKVEWLRTVEHRVAGEQKLIPLSWCRPLFPTLDIKKTVEVGSTQYRDDQFIDDFELPDTRYMIEKVVAKGRCSDEDYKDQNAVLIKWSGWDYVACSWEPLDSLYDDGCFADEDLVVCICLIVWFLYVF